MTFPFSITGSFTVAATTPTEKAKYKVLLELSDWLLENKASEVFLSAKDVVFRADLLTSAWARKMQVVVNSGRISVSSGQNEVTVNYLLMCTDALVLVTVVVTLISVPLSLYALLHPEDWQFILFTVAISWLWLFGRNYFVSWLKLRAALRHVATHAVAAE